MTRRDLINIWLKNGGNINRALILAADDFINSASAAYIRYRFKFEHNDSPREFHSIDEDEAWLKTGKTEE